MPVSGKEGQKSLTPWRRGYCKDCAEQILREREGHNGERVY